jgi:hypothetical protein
MGLTIFDIIKQNDNYVYIPNLYVQRYSKH